MTTDRADPGALPADTRIGRVALRVGSIDRVRPFYEEVVGLTAGRTDDGLVLGPSPEEPLVLLEEVPSAAERPAEAAGLFHLAVLVPGRAALGDAVHRLRSNGSSLSGASDHLVSEALYLRDPEGNGVEIYRDRPRDDWPETDDGLVGMQTLPLDLDDLEAAGDGDHVDQLPMGTQIGHVHLEVTALERSESFYDDTVGFGLRDRYGASATFLAAGGYHHHLGLNAWNGRSAPAGDYRGLDWWELVLPDEPSYQSILERLEDAGQAVRSVDEGVAVADPDEIELRLRTEP